MEKKGDYKYGIILYFILGLLVLGFSVYFIFNEYFNEDDQSREVCWQSVQLRALAPELEEKGFKLAKFKSKFPLKCKTRVVEIVKEDVSPDVKVAQKKIADAMVDCWALYGKGDYSVFPADFYGLRSTCAPCARIHLNDEAKKYLLGNEDVKISIRDSLNLRMNPDYTYYSYLKNSGDRFPALSLASSLDFDLEGDVFKIDKENVSAVFINKLTGAKDDGNLLGGLWKRYYIKTMHLPEFLEVGGGDLLINYGVVTSSNPGNIGDYIPYLFYFQTKQEPNPFEEVQKTLIDGELWKNVNVCENWEGIPG